MILRKYVKSRNYSRAIAIISCRIVSPKLRSGAITLTRRKYKPMSAVCDYTRSIYIISQMRKSNMINISSRTDINISGKRGGYVI